PHLRYRFSPAAPFESVPLTPPTSGSVWTATLPGFGCSDLPEYYFEAAGTISGAKTLPAGGPSAAYVASPGELAVRYHEDFEASDAGWVGGQPGDTATTGQWNRQDPDGRFNAQPENDVTPGAGVNCWVTDGRPGTAAGTFDVDNGYTTLLSAPYNLDRAPEATISYNRWFYNGGGAMNTFTVDISPDNTIWTRVETFGPSGPGTTGGWNQRTFRVGDFITPSATTRLRFRAADISGSIVEAAVDEITIIAPQCIDVCNPDVNADGNSDQDDIDYLIGVVAGGPNPTGAEPDFNRDGNVDASDIDALLNVVAGGNCP
ncbi:MAG: hypothetical protein WC718_14160, partial [Phycisphaerales bacterium]